MAAPPNAVLSHEEWVEKRKALLEREKELAQLQV
jgi:predicted dithiol-disulfide oxidoreductase (DUF899 family)